ncbi:hypothetical protein CONLIGDRAFT_686674 [Coniochaeta ligniaria NRRL 30616]|uniref:Uncharacterized protein n=1 Tax=Coniochaeta ligniaria NRRL 30616 TaxID=1408157 RepID=A0A1J7J250_9PEZI|nr:hypothetical protein CONLIGDRAFT_686674 [Coniochaeta ligniaria NRRL 30616]
MTGYTAAGGNEASCEATCCKVTCCGTTYCNGRSCEDEVAHCNGCCTMAGSCTACCTMTLATPIGLAVVVAIILIGVFFWTTRSKVVV